jgi:hypothetical protein
MRGLSGGSRRSTVRRRPPQRRGWSGGTLPGEIGNWGEFLPTLYGLYRVVTNTGYNPFADLSVERTDGVVAYAYM